MLADLAALEKALNDAFDAGEAPVLALEDMAGFAPASWNDLEFRHIRARAGSKCRDQRGSDLAGAEERRGPAGCPRRRKNPLAS